MQLYFLQHLQIQYMETTRKHDDDMIRSQTQLIPAVTQNRWPYLRKAAAKMKTELRERERRSMTSSVTSRHGLAAWITVTRYPV